MTSAGPSMGLGLKRQRSNQQRPSSPIGKTESIASVLSVGLLGFGLGFGLRHNGGPVWLVKRWYGAQYALYDCEQAFIKRGGE
jgi:hypothetical protein